MITGKTKVFGIFGDPVGHSLSPLMQNAAMAQAGIDGVYVPMHVLPDELERAVEGLRGMGIGGVNVTVPHKIEVCSYLDQIDPAARAAGAVNCIVNRDGLLTGYNTDGEGLLRGLQEDFGFEPSGKTVLLLGAGGAARGAAVAFVAAGVRRLLIANRTAERVASIARIVQELGEGEVLPLPLPLTGAEDLLASIDLVVNSTSLGLDGSPFDLIQWACLPPTTLVYDMVYHPQETPCVRSARGAGLRAVDGLSMLAGQGELSFAHWHGMLPEKGLMSGVLRRYCNREECV